MVIPGHPLWDYLRQSGAAEHDLWFMVEYACPPSLIGVNYYVTSERYLDHRLQKYPAHLQGGNGRHQYVDTEVVRAAPHQRTGLAGLMLEAWQRYGIPIVVTEAHLGDREDEQMRWLGEIWQQAQQAQANGVDVRAVTCWALLGLYDWHCLLTRRENIHEPGVFNVSSGCPEPTRLVAMLQGLAAEKPVESLVPSGLGWWQVENQFSSLKPSFVKDRLAIVAET